MRACALPLAQAAPTTLATASATPSTTTVAAAGTVATVAALLATPTSTQLAESTRRPGARRNAASTPTTRLSQGRRERLPRPLAVPRSPPQQGRGRQAQRDRVQQLRQGLTSRHQPLVVLTLCLRRLRVALMQFLPRVAGPFRLGLQRKSHAQGFLPPQRLCRPAEAEGKPPGNVRREVACPGAQRSWKLDRPSNRPRPHFLREVEMETRLGGKPPTPPAPTPPRLHESPTPPPTRHRDARRRRPQWPTAPLPPPQQQRPLQLLAPLTKPTVSLSAQAILRTLGTESATT